MRRDEPLSEDKMEVNERRRQRGGGDDVSWGDKNLIEQNNE
jgi:hypothetical protein